MRNEPQVGHEEATFETLCCAGRVAERDLGLVAGEEEDLAHERQREGAFGTGGKGNVDGHFVKLGTSPQQNGSRKEMLEVTHWGGCRWHSLAFRTSGDKPVQ